MNYEDDDLLAQGLAQLAGDPATEEEAAQSAVRFATSLRRLDDDPEEADRIAMIALATDIAFAANAEEFAAAANQEEPPAVYWRWPAVSEPDGVTIKGRPPHALPPARPGRGAPMVRSGKVQSIGPLWEALRFVLGTEDVLRRFRQLIWLISSLALLLAGLAVVGVAVAPQAVLAPILGAMAGTFGVGAFASLVTYLRLTRRREQPGDIDYPNDDVSRP